MRYLYSALMYLLTPIAFAMVLRRLGNLADDPARLALLGFMQEEEVARFMAMDGPVEAKTLRSFDPRFGEDVTEILDVRQSLVRRRTWGGPSPEAVRTQLSRAHDSIGRARYSLSKQAECVELLDRLLTEGSA